MAVVREFKTALGVTVRIVDDAYRDVSPEELARLRKEISDVINRINDNIRRKALQESPHAT